MSFDCSTCKSKAICSEGDNPYSEARPFSFPDYNTLRFDFCPGSLYQDVDFLLYFNQVWALQFGINTFGGCLTPDELEGLFTLTVLRARMVEKKYAEFWARALGGKK